jgi:hypothetical protein
MNIPPEALLFFLQSLPQAVVVVAALLLLTPVVMAALAAAPHLMGLASRAGLEIRQSPHQVKATMVAVSVVMALAVAAAGQVKVGGQIQVTMEAMAEMERPLLYLVRLYSMLAAVVAAIIPMLRAQVVLAV